jgi:hypothetical protein
MSRKSFDDGHQNAGHKFGKTDSYGFNLNFNEMHNLFHGHREVVSDVARDEGISFDEAAGFVPDAIAEVDADNLEYYDDYTKGEGGFDSPTNAGSYQDPDPYPDEHLGPEYYEANDLGDLVDPQNDTYEEEGTHGPALVVGAAAKAAAKGYMAARSNPKTGPMVKAGEAAVKEKGKEIAGKAMGTLKDKLKGKGGAGLASPDSEGVGTPDSDDPLA